jgi:hypothetical protein
VGSSGGAYTGSSNGNVPSSNTYYAINAGSTGSTTDTYDEVTPGVSETIKSLVFTLNTSSGSNHTAAVGYVTPGGVWTTALTCTISGGQNLTTCSASGSVSVPVGDSLNILASGNGNHSGTWVTSYTQP